MRSLAQPPGWDAGLPCFFFKRRDRFLPVLDGFLQTSELVHGTLTICRKHGALRRIVTIDEIGVQRVNARLHRVSKDLVAFKRLFERFLAATPILSVLAPIRLL